MVPGDDHERDSGRLAAVAMVHHAEGVLELGVSLHGSDEHVPDPGAEELHLELAVRRVGVVRRAVPHQDQVPVPAEREEAGADGLDGVVVVLGRGEQGLPHPEVGDPADVRDHGVHDVVVLDTVHDVGGLDDDLLEPLGGQLVHGLGDVVDAGPVALLDLSDDHAAGPGAPDLPVGEFVRDLLLDGVDRLLAGLVEAGTEAGHQDGLLAHCAGYIIQLLKQLSELDGRNDGIGEKGLGFGCRALRPGW